MNRDGIGESAQQVIDDLVRLKDEGRVRWNLLGMEVRDRWQELEQQVDEVLRTAREVTDATMERARNLREKLRS